MSRAQKLFSVLTKGTAIAGAITIVPYSCLFTVDGGERAVVWNMFSGVSNTTYGEGSHFYIPFLMRPLMYDIRTRPKLIQTTTGTNDLQTVTIHMRLLFKPRIEALDEIHRKLGQDYEQRVLPSIGNEVLKAVVAKYNAEQLLTQRQQVSDQIRAAIKKRCEAFDIELDDVAITHLVYGKEFSRAIEEKQVAQQEAERQKFLVAKSEQERIAAVTLAEGEAEAAKKISDAIKKHGSGLLKVRQIDTSKDIALAFAKHPNVTYVPDGQNVLFNMSGAKS